jgi:hypothetical protein
LYEKERNAVKPKSNAELFIVPEKPLLHGSKDALGITSSGKTSFSGTLKSPAM